MSKDNNKPTHFCFTTNVIWSQVDANGHMRHSAYADIAAHARVVALEESGLSLKKFHEWHIGPVLLKEELVYFREVHLNDELRVTCELQHTNEDVSRWTIFQEIYRSDGIRAATVTVHGTWIDTQKRKMTGLQGQALEYFNKLPKSIDFTSSKTVRE